MVIFDRATRLHRRAALTIAADALLVVDGHVRGVAHERLVVRVGIARWSGFNVHPIWHKRSKPSLGGAAPRLSRVRFLPILSTILLILLDA